MVGLVEAEGRGQVEPGGDLLLEVVAEQCAQAQQRGQVRIVREIEREGLLRRGRAEGAVSGEGDQWLHERRSRVAAARTLSSS